MIQGDTDIYMVHKQACRNKDRDNHISKLKKSIKNLSRSITYKEVNSDPQRIQQN